MLAPSPDPDLAAACLTARADLGDRAALAELRHERRPNADARYADAIVAPRILTFACEACHSIVRGPRARCNACGRENVNAQAIR